MISSAHVVLRPFKLVCKRSLEVWGMKTTEALDCCENSLWVILMGVQKT